MLINTRLIQNYLDKPLSAEQVQAALMTAGIEVEEAYNLADALADIRVGFVRSISPLQGSATNHVCRVDVGEDEPVPIVCGSEHEVKEGWGVPVALPGTRLPARKHAIEQTTIRDQPSHGMICLDGEMGLHIRSTGMQVFDESIKPGTRLVDAIDIDEQLLEVSVLPNRPDCLGLIGIAREIAAAVGCNVVYPKLEYPGLLDDAQQQGGPEVDNRATDRCSRYLCARFDGVRVAKSPGWLKNALLTLGARPINNVVDITNFVMFEWGNPLHAFDDESLTGERIVVRKAGAKETMRLLDGTDLELSDSDLVIADEKGAIALAGVMGGASSQTRPETARVLLEAAHFEPTGIRATRRRLGLSTDSSYRFERGTDPNRMLAGAFQRAADLLQQLAGAKRLGGVGQSLARQTEPRTFTLSPAKASSYLGLDITAGQITDALTRLGMGCDTSGGAVRVEVPTWRVDIDDPVVLIEDVARITGYDAIASQAPTVTRAASKRSALDDRRDALAGFLSSQGFYECRTIPLVDASQPLFFEPGQTPLKLVNPMKENESVLRQSLLPALVAAVDQNARRSTGLSRFFEIDRVFHTADGEPRDRWVLAGVLGGTTRDLSWSNNQPADFYHAKGIVENILQLIGVASPRFAHGELPGMKPGATAAITSDGQAVGHLGQIDKNALRGLHVPHALFGFQLDIERVSGQVRSRFRSLPRYPAIDRDLAILVDRATPYREIEQAVCQAVKTYADSAGDALALSEEDLESVLCFDRYEGKGIPASKVSLGLRVVFRSAERTLKTEAIDAVFDAIVKALGEQFGAELRQS
ncbi:MAG: phenylalanine--tRNA ligase subunit beta [Phycisphaeraceae bacterium]